MRGTQVSLKNTPVSLKSTPASLNSTQVSIYVGGCSCLASLACFVHASHIGLACLARLARMARMASMAYTFGSLARWLAHWPHSSTNGSRVCLCFLRASLVYLCNNAFHFQSSLGIFRCEKSRTGHHSARRCCCRPYWKIWIGQLGSKVSLTFNSCVKICLTEKPSLRENGNV